MLDEVSILFYFLFQFFDKCKEFQELCGKLIFYKKRTYGLGVIKFLVLGPNFGNQFFLF